jgi:hypothetical protein
MSNFSHPHIPSLRLSSEPLHDSATRKKRRRGLQQSPPRRRRPLSELLRQYSKLHTLLDQRSRNAASSGTKGRLPSPALSVAQRIDIRMPPNDSSLRHSSKATPPTLTEITFRPHSAHCYSFIATIREGCDGKWISLSHVIQLITIIGHTGKIDDFTIKSIEQHSYLLTGFSWHT